MDERLKKTMDAAKKLLEACQKNPGLADELAKSLEKKQGVPKGVDPDKQERCVKDVKSQPGAKNPYAICNASMTKEELQSCMKDDESKPWWKGKGRPNRTMKQYMAGKPTPEKDQQAIKDQEPPKAPKMKKTEVQVMMKADDAILAKAKILAGPGHKKPAGTVLADLPSPDVGKRPEVSGNNPDMAAIRAQHGGPRQKLRSMAKKPKMAKAGIYKDEKNPDKAADAALGEKVEQAVETHMQANSAAERKEGHQMASKK